MTRFSESKIAQLWLSRFTNSELSVATSLLDEILLVNASEFKRGIENLLSSIQLKIGEGHSTALYAEREVEAKSKKILPIFPYSEEGRSIGKGPNPIPFDTKGSEVGSEGILANIITNHCRNYGSISLNHPGPDAMRENRSRAIIIVSDFIGSGKRVWSMLEAFRAVPTIRSWKSYKLINFYVVAYSGTEEGISKVRSSRLRPTVLTAYGCPTIYSSFKGKKQTLVENLCRSYPPNDRFPFGYGCSGALIAFEHGVPNNVPPILHRGWEQWQPLFRRRSTISASSYFPVASEEIVARAQSLLRVRDASEYFTSPREQRWIETMVVLAAIEIGARSLASISAQAHLELSSVREILTFTQSVRWTTPANQLTSLGRSELRRLRRRRPPIPLPKQEQLYYYPTQLRAR